MFAQLVPFADKLLGISGAMDNRMIDRQYDWWVRLPLVLVTLAALLSPTALGRQFLNLARLSLLFVAHVANVVFWFDRMPAVWDYMVSPKSSSTDTILEPLTFSEFA